MIFGTQFTGSVAAGQVRSWFTHSWNPNWNVVWIVVPTGPAVDGAAQVEWKIRNTRQAPNLIQWFIEVRNVTNVAVTFQARYCILNA